MCHETWREDHPVDASHNYVEQQFIGARQRERRASVLTRHLHIWSSIIVEDTDVLRWMCHKDRLLLHNLSSPFGLEQTLFIRLITVCDGAHGECMRVHGGVQAEATRAESNTRLAAEIRNIVVYATI